MRCVLLNSNQTYIIEHNIQYRKMQPTQSMKSQID